MIDDLSRFFSTTVNSSPRGLTAIYCQSLPFGGEVENPDLDAGSGVWYHLRQEVTDIMAKVWQKVTEACHSLGVSQRTLYRMIKRGDIESKVENKRRLVLVDLPDDVPEADRLASTELVEELRNRVEFLTDQIEIKDQQIDRLQTLLIAEKAESQKLLEYRQPFWRRWFGRKEKKT